MAVEPNYTFNIHVQDGVNISAVRVPSQSDDFVSLRIGWQSSVLLMNADQAKALVDAAEDAYFILRGIEEEKARAERARARDNYSYPVIREADPELERLLAEEEEIERRTRYTYNEDPCSCSDCQRMDEEYEPF